MAMMKIFINAFFILLFTASIGACNPFKVTDPSDPKFNPDKFSFSDYKTPEDLRDAFRKLFPVGTDRAFVERVLVEAGGGEIVDSFDFLAKGNKYYNVKYAEPFNPVRSFKQPIPYLVTYRENGSLTNIFINGGLRVHDNKLDWESLTDDTGERE